MSVSSPTSDTPFEGLPTGDIGRYSRLSVNVSLPILDISFKDIPVSDIGRYPRPPTSEKLPLSHRLRTSSPCMAFVLALWTVLAIGVSFSFSPPLHTNPPYGAPWVHFDVLINVNLYLAGFWLIFLVCIVIPTRTHELFWRHIKVMIGSELSALFVLALSYLIGYIRHLNGYDSDISGAVPIDVDFISPGLFILFIGGSCPALCVYTLWITCIHRRRAQKMLKFQVVQMTDPQDIELSSLEVEQL